MSSALHVEPLNPTPDPKSSTSKKPRMWWVFFSLMNLPIFGYILSILALALTISRESFRDQAGTEEGKTWLFIIVFIALLLLILHARKMLKSSIDKANIGIIDIVYNTMATAVVLFIFAANNGFYNQHPVDTITPSFLQKPLAESRLLYLQTKRDNLLIPQIQAAKKVSLYVDEMLPWATKETQTVNDLLKATRYFSNYSVFAPFDKNDQAALKAFIERREAEVAEIEVAEDLGAIYALSIEISPCEVKEIHPDTNICTAGVGQTFFAIEWASDRIKPVFLYLMAVFAAYLFWQRRQKKGLEQKEQSQDSRTHSDIG